MFKRLLNGLSGSRTAEPPAAAEVAATGPADELITAYDAYGREVRVRRGDWRDSVLLPGLSRHWDDADELAGLLTAALRDGFAAELSDGARRLAEIDPDAERAHALLGVVLLETERLDEAEAVLRAGMAGAGETAMLLVNLAKVQSRRGDAAEAEATLWRAIVTDPNVDNAVLWWASLQRDRGGESAHAAALERISKLPGSWRANLWLARRMLDEGRLQEALAIYRDAPTRDNFSPDALTMISGDLGRSGHVALIPDIVAPAYDPDSHDPRTGLNLLQAYADLDMDERGESLLRRLYALNLSPFKPALDRHSRAFLERRRSRDKPTPVDPTRLVIEMRALPTPLWRIGLREPGWLLKRKDADAAVVVFHALAQRRGPDAAAERSTEDDAGRMTRAIPLYLAEAVHAWTDHAASTLIPIADRTGPVVFGAEADPDALFASAPPAARFLVTGILERREAGWQVIVRLWDVPRRVLVATAAEQATPEGLGQAVLKLEATVLAHLGPVRAAPFDILYTRPPAALMTPYLSSLGQTLALTLCAIGETDPAQLWGERNILETPLLLALQAPRTPHLRLMFLSGLSLASDYRSIVLAEFHGRALEMIRMAERNGEILSRFKPLVLAAFDDREALGDFARDLASSDDDAYRRWAQRVIERRAGTGLS